MPETSPPSPPSQGWIGGLARQAPGPAGAPVPRFAASVRARRAEFWWFLLFINLGLLAAAVLEYPQSNAPYNKGPLSLLFGLAVLLLLLCVTIRRLHDIGRGGFWLLLPLVNIPVSRAHEPAGIALAIRFFLTFFVWTVTPSQPGTNRFGPSPLEQ
ncbi:MAG: DUF805 domain-containing protein [Paracoccus sp. (in: a-proteobacteria)]|nr:DUF805 domain-containing protein [Paracoccus sp. (in: a-proteobacteria)]